MRTNAILLIAVFCGVTHGSAVLSATQETPRRNVLFIAVDDLRPELGCYGARHIKSPNIDRLAARGLLFRRAYCQQAVCNPSRTSLMTGLRPDTIGVTGNHVHFRDKRPNVVTLPQHFKRHVYHAQSIGKIYHGVFPEGTSKTVWDTMGDPPSWSVPTTRFGPRYYFTEDGIRQAKQAYEAMYRPRNAGADDWTEKLVFGPMTEAPDIPDNTLYDGKVADAAIQTLRRLAKNPEEVSPKSARPGVTGGGASGKLESPPFFLAVGFIKPHTPFVAPKRYWDLYDPKEIRLATNPEFPVDAPPIAGHGSGEVRRYTDQPKRGPFGQDNQRRLKHGYFACISFIDAQIGRVLDELDRLDLTDSTIIVLFGDHGWHLGEHNLWGKTTNFELDTRAPLIVSAPGMQAKGEKTDALVEFVDIYPTLAELAGLATPDQLEGTSFAPLLNDPNRPWKTAAFSQYPRGGNADTGGKVMGHSMRTDRWRYTEWIQRDGQDVVDRELYDHQKDPQETQNLAGRPENADLVTGLSRQLDRGNGWRRASPEAAADDEPRRSTVYELRDGGDSKSGYRIPALAVTAKGTLLAFCERRVGLSDHAQNDIVLRRSKDGGKTWGPVQVIADHGGDSLNDPQVVVLDTGRILLRFTRYPQGVHTRNSGHTVIAEPGYGGPKNTRIYLVHSEDDGKTWSAPRDMTKQLRREQAVAVGSPGVGIQLTRPPHRGRVVMPNYEVYSLGGGERKSANSVSYSDDGGQTWNLSGTIDEGGLTGFGNEAQLVELEDGAIFMSARDHRGGKHRKFSVSRDGGETWSAHCLAEQLLTPACMSSVIRYAWPNDGQPGLLLHSLPNTEKQRARGTIFASRDEGRSWTKARVLESGGFAYSCLVRLPDGDIGCLYESGGYRSIVFARFTLDWLLAVSDFAVAGNLQERPQPPPWTDVFVAGQEYPSFRIPSVVTTGRGTLLAFAEGRAKHSDHAANDIVLKRSTNDGKTWGELIVVANDGDNSLNNPQAVVLPKNDRVLLMYQRYPQGVHERQVEPGYDGPRICRNFLVVSDDDGLKWSAPRDVTRMVKRPVHVTSIAGGPGVGIVLRHGKYKGRIIMPMNQGPFGRWKVYAAYSDDDGETWKYGDTAPDDEKGVGNEVQMVELADGTVMLNSRTQGGTMHRKVALSTDGGKTWTALRDDLSLPEPQCQASILRYSDPHDGPRSRILFANPASQSGRKNGTLRISYDEGKTWPVGKTIYPGGYAYSCLTMLPDGSIGVLFERDGYRAVSFTRVTLGWLTGEKDVDSTTEKRPQDQGAAHQ